MARLNPALGLSREQELERMRQLDEARLREPRGRDASGGGAERGLLALDELPPWLAQTEVAAAGTRARGGPSRGGGEARRERRRGRRGGKRGGRADANGWGARPALSAGRSRAAISSNATAATRTDEPVLGPRERGVTSRATPTAADPHPAARRRDGAGWKRRARGCRPTSWLAVRLDRTRRSNTEDSIGRASRRLQVEPLLCFAGLAAWADDAPMTRRALFALLVQRLASAMDRIMQATPPSGRRAAPSDERTCTEELATPRRSRRACSTRLEQSAPPDPQMAASNSMRR